MQPEPADIVFRHTHLLGTVIEVRLRADGVESARAADRAIVDEVVRLEAVFSVHDDRSELSRWKRDMAEPSAELVEVMSAALWWHDRSGGAFNTMCGVLSDVWRRAERDDRLPSSTELRHAADSIVEPRFSVDDGVVRRVGDCAALDLNAIAKGYIVDRACAQVMERGDVSMAVLSAGGDVLHRGVPSSRVGIENPLRAYDNEPPLTVIDLLDAGLATSGGSRRGVRIRGRRFSHVIDPRSGEPVSEQASISVAAPTAMTADVLATTLGVSAPAEAVAASETFEGCACLVIGNDGSRWPDSTWLSRFGEP